MNLIVLDVDGVLSVGEAQPFNFRLLERLARLNRAAANGAGAPAVTLNTGRPSPYVEAVMQMIAGWQPALYESGAGLYLPQGYQFRTNPGLTPEHMALLRQALDLLDRDLVTPGRAYWQPGKVVCHSLLAQPPLTAAELLPEVEAVVARLTDRIAVSRAGITINIHPAGIDKGSGLEWLAGVTGINPADMAGVGDSTADIDFLRLVGYAAAPANARDEVKAAVGYVSPQPDAAGLHDILDYWGLPE